MAEPVTPFLPARAGRHKDRACPDSRPRSRPSTEANIILPIAAARPQVQVANSWVARSQQVRLHLPVKSPHQGARPGHPAVRQPRPPPPRVQRSRRLCRAHCRTPASCGSRRCCGWCRCRNRRSGAGCRTEAFRSLCVLPGASRSGASRTSAAGSHSREAGHDGHPDNSCRCRNHFYHLQEGHSCGPPHTTARVAETRPEQCGLDAARTAAAIQRRHRARAGHDVGDCRLQAVHRRGALLAVRAQTRPSRPV